MHRASTRTRGQLVGASAITAIVMGVVVWFAVLLVIAMWFLIHACSLSDGHYDECAAREAGAQPWLIGTIVVALIAIAVTARGMVRVTASKAGVRALGRWCSLGLSVVLAVGSLALVGLTLLLGSANSAVATVVVPLLLVPAFVGWTALVDRQVRARGGADAEPAR